MDRPLKILRISLGLTQEQLGKTLGISRGRVCQIELGQGNLGNENLLKLAESFRIDIARLGFTLEDFLRGETPKSAA